MDQGVNPVEAALWLQKLWSVSGIAQSRGEKEWGESSFQEVPHFLSVFLDISPVALVSQVLLENPE